MSAMTILAVGLFVTALCGFGLWFTIVEIRRLSSRAPSDEPGRPA